MKDFIKWMCGYADGFEIIEYPNGYNHYRAPHREHSMEIEGFAMHLKCDKHEYSLLLQRAIEGVNKKTDIKIESYPYYYRVYKSGEFINVFNHDSQPIDKTKENLLLWIKEHE